MLEKLSDDPDGVVGVKAIGKVTREDYASVLDGLFDDARREGRRLRVLYEIGPEFTALPRALPGKTRSSVSARCEPLRAALS